MIATQAAGGAVSGGTCNVLSKKAQGQDANLKDFGQGAVIGGIGGAVGTGFGVMGGSVASKIGSGAAGTVGREIGSSGTQALRVLINSAFSSAGSAGSQALGVFAYNVMTYGNISKYVIIILKIS